ncbi:xanthine dehydrogenase family protein [candidate division KSB1 bacterium]|nr:xanthine dehydrogenase family protein [candidate division KSB1 bacterium]
MNQKTKKAWRNDAYAKVTGKAKYAADLKFHNMLHAVPVYSNFVHAKLRHVDTSQAERVEGVVRVLTAKDVPGAVRWGQIQKDYRMLVDDHIRCHGDVVAIVVANTRAIALDAAELVKIEAEELPMLFDPDEAMKPDAMLIHEDKGTNIVAHHRVRTGEVQQGFAQSDHILEHEFRTQFIEHAYMEPEAAICNPRSDGVMDVYGGMQHPFSTRRFTAAMLGVKLSDVEIIEVPMGGAFGGKDDTIAIICARTALAAQLTGRPVKMVYEREWSIRESYKRHPYKMSYKMGIKSDGKIQAVQCRMVADAGAYCSVSPWVTWRSTVQCCGPYKVEHVHCDVYAAHTNNVFTGAMRGFGAPQVNFAIEQLMDMAAEKVGMNPIEFRQHNLLRQGDTTVTGQTLDTHRVSLDQVLDTVVDKIDYHTKLKRCSRGKSKSDELYGIGLALSYRGASLGAEGVDFCSAIINVQQDGSILLETGVHENGQGAETTMIMLLANELGVKKERIRYRRASTSTIPDGGTTVASRGTIMGGGAVVNAVKILKQIFADGLADELGCDENSIVFENEQIRNQQGDRSIAFDEAILRLFSRQIYPYAFGVFQAPQVSWDEESGQGNAYFTWVYSCQAVEVLVNKSSGKITVTNAVAAHDIGKAINRSGLLGQIYGGMTMGMGYALSEEIISENGIIITTNLNKYKLLHSTDVPDIQAIIVENNDPVSPSGAKGIGEPALEIAAAAVANAVYQATETRYFELPIKAHRP